MTIKSHESTSHTVAAPSTEPVIQTSGDVTLFKPLYRIERDGVLINACWALEFRGVGCVIRTFTREGDQIAEALTFVSGVRIVEDVDGGLKLQNANP